MHEFERIAKFWRPLAADFPGARNLEDDAALLTHKPGCELVVTTDAIVEGVHFFGDDPPGRIAQKLLRVNLSDLAAKGAEPYAYTLMTALPDTITDAWLERFAEGLRQDQKQFGITLIGGDTVSTIGPIVLSITAFGQAPAGKAIARGGARPGDHVFVTGRIGEAALGLKALKEKSRLDSSVSAWIDRYHLPQPRLMLAPLLLDVASASIDVSDGLIGDLDHICQASSVSAKIELASIPLPDKAISRMEIADLITGGDDYEILFTAPRAATDAIQSFGKINDISISHIGEIINQGEHCAYVYDPAGNQIEFARRGWRHGA